MRTVSQANDSCSVPGIGLNLGIHLGDGHRFDLLAPVGAEHGVRGVDRHAHTVQLVPVHLVAAAFGQRLTKPTTWMPACKAW